MVKEHLNRFRVKDSGLAFRICVLDLGSGLRVLDLGFRVSVPSVLSFNTWPRRINNDSHVAHLR